MYKWLYPLLCYSFVPLFCAPSSLDDALKMLQSGDAASASRLLLEISEREPRNEKVLNLLGIAQAELGRGEASSQAFEGALRINPDFLPAQENYGLVLFRASRFPQAKQHLDRALQLGSTNPGAAFSYAVSCLRTGEATQGLERLRALESLFAKEPGYWEERAFAEPDEANLSRAVDLNPRSVRLLNAAAFAAAKAGDQDRAVALLLRAKKEAPADVPTLVHFGEICLRRNLASDALAALETAHNLEPQNNMALYLLASAHLAVQDYAGAYALFQDFTVRAPDYPVTWYVLGWVDLKLNRTAAARTHFEHSVHLAAHYADPLIELAQLDLIEGRLDAAEIRLTGVLADRPENAKANLAMGDLLVRRNRAADAEAFLEKAIAADPKLAAAHYKLAMLLYRKQENARADMERARAAELTAEAQREGRTILKIAAPAAGEIPSP